MEFEHAVDKTQIPTVKILGVDIAAINMDWLIRFTKDNINKLSGDYMCVANVHTTVTASEDEEYKKIQNNGIMAIPDGGPLSSVGRKKGAVNMYRTTGPSYMEEMLKIGGYSHFFYGSSEETIAVLKEKLAREYPQSKIVGMFSPPFRELSSEEDVEVISMINQAHPDFLWVGLGAPKQERWMVAPQGKVSGFMVGVGAAFDYFAGNIKRAPQWMQKANLEWLYRLLQDPKRLFKRYFITNTKFIWNVVVRGK